MTKTLTEQWRERTLKSGTYYIKVNLGDNLIYTFDYYNDRNNKWDFHRDIREILDVVPSYDEYKKLEQQLAELQTEENNLLNDIVDLNLTIENMDKKLEIATKALKRYEDKQNWDIRGVSFMKYNKGFTIAHKALKEIEGVK